MSAPGSRPRFTLYTRPGCELCEHLLLELQSQPGAGRWEIELQDVDADPLLRARYGHKIPVLMLDGELVCHGRLDAGELRKALAVRG